MKQHLGLIEMLFIFGCGLGFVIWELLSLRRSSRRDKPDDNANASKKELP